MRFGLERLRRQPLLLIESEEMPHEIGDVLGPLAQAAASRIGTTLRRKNRSSRNKPCWMSPRKLLVRRRDDPHIRLDRHAAADRGVFALLQHAQEARLRLHRHVADFVEEERAAFRLLEAADRAGERAREGALLMAEQLAISMRSRGIAAMLTATNGPLAPFAEIMESARDELLAGAEFAIDHHRQIGLHEPGQDPVDILHRRPSVRRAACSRSSILAALLRSRLPGRKGAADDRRRSP